ncbi:MAG: ATP-binding protein [Planctomycetaceae bacterium]|nr:ATP-binding protein [Planctomycetaceae bacterium]
MTAVGVPARSTILHRHAPPVQTAQDQVAFGSIPSGAGHRIVVYGPGGVGKTTWSVTGPHPLAIFDLEESLPVLRGQLPEQLQQVINNVAAIQDRSGAEGWQGLRDALHMRGWDQIKTIVIDSATKAEEWAAAWVIKNVPHEKGNRIERIEDYGFGKGYSHIYETFLALLGDLDQHVRAGRNVVLIAHDCTAEVPNPAGEDYIRYEPRLQSPASGKNSIRLRVREWADHVLFIGYDLDAKDGKAKGSGTRTIYPVELPHCMAKSRTMSEPMPLNKFDTAVWARLLGQK